jgi:hypothetical protein
LPSESASFETMIVRRVLSQQRGAIAKDPRGLLNSSQKRTFLRQQEGMLGRSSKGNSLC